LFPFGFFITLLKNAGPYCVRVLAHRLTSKLKDNPFSVPMAAYAAIYLFSDSLFHPQNEDSPYRGDKGLA
jgi:hypothetical protein